MKDILNTLGLLLVSFFVIAEETPLPSKSQLRWQSNECAMFVHVSPATWQSREYDNQTTSLGQINLSQLNTDQWCETAKLWGAKMIVFVAKHVGGFCWWQTNTTDYCIKNTPFRSGKGDVLKELSESCKKYGLDLGVYVYPGDEQWGAGIGSGGTTKDSSKQEEYNRVFRQQLTEVLTRYGKMREVWFDGNCNIYIADILQKYASDAVIFQSKSASIRWVGNEDGYAPYPNWYTLKKEDLATGVATALHSNVHGDVYAPVEVDVPFFKNNGHKWFWAPDMDHLLMNTEQLMNLYYKSVGRGAVLLMNSTPDTSGLIPASHVEVYRKLGEEIKKRFEHPVAKTSGKGNMKIVFDKPIPVNHLIIQEDLSGGQRVTSYIIQGLKNNKWIDLYKGQSIGNKKIDYFNSIELEGIQVLFVHPKDIPLIKNCAVYYVNSDFNDFNSNEHPEVVGNWEASTYDSDWKDLVLDLTEHMNEIGQYEVYFSTLAYDFTSKLPSGIEIKDIELEMYGKSISDAWQFFPDENRIRINRSQQTLNEFNTMLKMKVRSKPSKSSGDIMIKRIIY